MRRRRRDQASPLTFSTLMYHFWRTSSSIPNSIPNWYPLPKLLPLELSDELRSDGLLDVHFFGFSHRRGEGGGSSMAWPKGLIVQNNVVPDGSNELYCN